MSKGKWRQYKAKDNVKKNDFIGVALTAKEKLLLKQKAEQCNLVLSEYVVVKTIYEDIFETIACKKELYNLENEFNAIGKNLNQTTKALNTLAKSSNQSSSITIYNSLKEIERIRTQFDKTCKELRCVLTKIETTEK